MTLEQFTRNEGQLTRQYEYDECSVLAVDFGADETDASVDLVDDTVIVIVDDEQYELELPDGADDAHTFIKNGVLTVEMEGDL
ncbi:Hsp20/alpha crystallin family protein [Natronorubrum sp. JWXQ-INN-674]|uniref:Hsp20/alpha crystallin family protein n=1 Tax=Natronorubrum halalkaliphilum TaxID=2691917 RepID=A0A6B0VLM0_9EURY|nr:Hsp20/alpha crystallin family protein [Natronorubrum halalkaliphilum]MXV61479.1 Hsp20/alpha crystallin family protein [Natronorubrum halalkaliphilum]